MLKSEYKILPIGDIDPAWFTVIMQKNIDQCRKSNDGTLVILKLPPQVQSVDDVPEEWVADYTANMPYMTHAEALNTMSSLAWIAPEA